MIFDKDMAKCTGLTETSTKVNGGMENKLLKVIFLI